MFQKLTTPGQCFKIWPPLAYVLIAGQPWPMFKKQVTLGLSFKSWSHLAYVLIAGHPCPGLYIRRGTFTFVFPSYIRCGLPFTGYKTADIICTF